MKRDTQAAKDFLLSKLLDQARREAAALSDIERRMFLFSETCQDPPDFEASQRFDKEYESQAYETKVSTLLKHAYAGDSEVMQEAKRWKKCLDTLKDEDFYGLVMVDQAGIPRSRPKIASPGLWSILVGALPVGTAMLCVVAVGGLVVFQPSRLHLALPDWLRWVLFVVFAGIVWWVGKIFSGKPTHR